VRSLAKDIAFIRPFLVELALYACFVSAYFFLVLYSLGGWIDEVYEKDRTLYAFLAVALIAVQGMALGKVTSAMLWLVKRLQAIILMLRRLTRPHETVTRTKEAPGLLVYRFAGPLFFFNAEHFANRVQELIDSANPAVTVFLINAEAIVDMDAEAAKTLAELHGRLDEQNIILAVCEAKGHFLKALRDSPLVERDTFNLYPSVAAAIQEIKKRNSHRD
jgi:MFS superfamily sulfate permease-like transporter